MCGRFSLISPEEILARLFKLNDVPPIAPRYNIAPSQAVPGVIFSAGKKENQLAFFRWGLIPAWTKDATRCAKSINACSETVFEKAAFRVPILRRRCLIPADGFFEWKKTKGEKQPYFIRLKGEQTFAFAGIWERWQGTPEAPVESCAILTTAANNLIQPLHERMPVILPPEDYGAWLDPENQKAENIQPMFRPYPANAMEALAVGDWVNSAAHDGPRCIEVREDETEDLFSF
ncbi:MAG: SOS response-associated peptidase [Candidatus Omnitrophota bacterium]